MPEDGCFLMFIENEIIAAIIATMRKTIINLDSQILGSHFLMPKSWPCSP